MLRISRTVYPGETTLTFNQQQAVRYLLLHGDLKVFNDYCSIVKLTQEEINQCLESIKTKELGFQHRIIN